jgi:glyoxylate reductase
VTRELTDGVMARMEELFDTRLNREDRALTRAELEAAVADADVLVPTITDRIDADLIAKAAPRLKLIANFGVGVDHIDLHAARERRILVTNTPGVLTEDTADMTMALILSVPRRLGEGEKLIRAGAWDGWKPSGMLGHRVNGSLAWAALAALSRAGRRALAFAQFITIATACLKA